MKYIKISKKIDLWNDQEKYSEPWYREPKSQEIFKPVQPSVVKPCSNLDRELTKNIFKTWSLSAVLFP